jgi:hypothetical protein
MLLNLTGCACGCDSVGQDPSSSSLHPADHMSLEHNHEGISIMEAPVCIDEHGMLLACNCTQPLTFT